MPTHRSNPIPNNATAGRGHRAGPLAVRPGGLVIQAFQLKYQAMPARSLALALLILLFVMPAGVDAEPAGETAGRDKEFDKGCTQTGRQPRLDHEPAIERRAHAQPD